MAAPKKKINLLVREGFEHTTVGRVLNWSLSAGRVIVIITELIVIIAFLSRFWLDKSLTDLNNKNASLKAQIQAASSFEEEFRNAQERLSAYKKLDARAEKTGELIRKISALLPADASLTGISFVEKEITLRGIALSEEGLAGFIKALRDSGQFTSVAIFDISLDSSLQQSLNFILKLETQ